MTTDTALAPTEACARQLDAEDTLARFRACFYCDPDLLYFDGNSLGLLSRQAEASVLRILHEWKTLGVEGWSRAEPPWFTLAEQLGRQTAPLLGAEPNAVIVANSTTVNLHQLLATLFQPTETRACLLADELAFPSDIHALSSHLRLRSLDPDRHLIRVRSRDGFTLDEDDILAAMTKEVQIAVLPAVLYQSGQLLDMARLTAEAHRRGVLIGFDCAHSLGATPHQLDAWGVDFAFWCNYKYLNNGPGGTGGLYLNRRHFGRAPGMAGWFGSRKDLQFAMSHTLEPAEGAGALQIGTPNILSMAPLEGSLQLIAEAGIEHLRHKSLRLTAYLRALLESELDGSGFTLVTPLEDHRRGGHLALAHEEAIRICKALRAANVVPDYRPPRIVRLAPVPLYTTFLDCYEVVRRLKRIMESRSYQHYPAERSLVP